MMITDYGTWFMENRRRAGQSKEFHIRIGRPGPYEEPDLTHLANRADLMRCSDGAIHTWWACTDPKICAHWIDIARKAP